MQYGLQFQNTTENNKKVHREIIKYLLKVLMPKVKLLCTVEEMTKGVEGFSIYRTVRPHNTEL